ncbi:MAG: branched-chain amino acid aminotransferase [Chitinispirillaceae bacterium]|nr:branched-chain amino acid aminotransferase [Chitinispirillaceae bacterium]
MKQKINWRELGFTYMQTDNFIVVEYHNGAWGKPQCRADTMIQLHIGASCLHYGQAAFEGLKAFTRRDGSIGLFRPLENARRMNATAGRLVMQAPSEELFMEAIRLLIANNRDWVPPYGTGASLYIRPLLIGTTARVGVKPADDYLFAVLCMPVGPYYKNGFYPVKAYVQEQYDRAAPLGVGNVKASGNYSAGMLGDLEGKEKGFPICLYLDSATHTFIDEFGTSNFLGITGDNRYVTPDSTSVLPSITNSSLQQIAADFGMKVERRRISLKELPEFNEIGACGTAAVITPIYSIACRGKVYTFGKEKEAGTTLTKLFKRIQGIQYGEIEDRHGWMVGCEGERSNESEAGRKGNGKRQGAAVGDQDEM